MRSVHGAALRTLRAAQFPHGPVDGNLWFHHPEGGGPEAHPASEVFAIKDAEDLELVVGVFLIVTLFLAWLVGRCRTARAEDDVTTKTAKQDVVEWLGILSVVTAALLMLQVGLGYISGSLTLLADLAHGAGDTVTYFAAYVAEKIKGDLSQRAGATAYVAKLDLLAGITSTLIVAGVCFNAMWEAWEELELHGRVAPSTVPANRFIGPAILNFAVVSLAANIGLLLLRFRSDEPAEVASAAVPPPPPAPVPSEDDGPAGGRAGRRPRTARQQPQSQETQSQQPGGEQKTTAAAKWMHAMFHPGCECSDHSLKSPAAEKVHDNNLNLFAATLHLATDVLRSVLVLLVGLLLQAGILTEVERTDAMCALVVGSCVLLGTIGFFAVPCAQVVEQLRAFGSQV